MRQSLAEAGTTSALKKGDEPIAGFRLVRRRGRGGFGEVWEAEASGGIHVALKFIKFSARAQASELRALNFVRGLHHPNLLANFGSWQVDDTLIVGMELADGSLWDRYGEAADQGLRGIPRAELLGYMADAAGGIDYLNDTRHTVDGRSGQGVQHRDIKPPNLLLFGGGAKVADLGLARAMEGESASHTGIWTFPYAAPEFFRGLTTRQSDQYGLAVTYCQLRCGRLPFAGNAAAVTAGHLFGQPELGDLPEAERPILERALAKNPGDRWPDCRTFVQALGSVEAPDLLLDPDNSDDDIPRMYRSSTGSGDFLTAGPDQFEDAPYPSWRLFDSVGSSNPLMDTPDHPAPQCPASAPTAVNPPAFAEPEATSVDRRRPRRIGRHAASMLAVGLALAASGVRPSIDRDPGIQEAPAPATLAATFGGVDDGTRPRPSGPASTAPTPSARTVPEASARPTPPPEPLPSPPTAEKGRGEGTSDREGPSIEPPKPAALATTLPERTEDLEVRTASGSDQGPMAIPPIVPGLGVLAVNLAGSRVDRAIEPRRDPARDRPRPGPAEVAAGAEIRGRVLLSKGAYDRAIAEFDQAIRLRPGFAPTYLHRALARHRASHYPEALADYAEAIRLRPDDPFAYIARGQAHHDLGAYARAIADYTEALRLRADDPVALYRRGLAHYRSNDYAGALADLTETIRLDPKNAGARDFRNDALARLGGRAGDGLDRSTLKSAAPANPPGSRPGGAAASQPGPGRKIR